MHAYIMHYQSIVCIALVVIWDGLCSSLYSVCVCIHACPVHLLHILCLGFTVRGEKRANLDPSKFENVCYECWKGLVIQRMNAKTGRCQHQKVFTRLSDEALCSPDEALLPLTCTDFIPHTYVLLRAA